MMLATPVDSAALLIAVIPTLVTLDVIVIVGRLYGKRRLRQPMYADDWCVLVAMVFIIIMSALLTSGLAPRLIGVELKHEPENWDYVLKVMEILGEMRPLFPTYIVFLVPTLGLIKTSLMLSYRRVFVTNKGTQKRYVVLQIMTALVIAWTIGFFFAFIFPCKGEMIERNCALHTEVVLQAFCATDFFMNLPLLLIPLTLVWQLQLPLGRKIGLGFIFLLGGVSAAVSFFNMIWVIWIGPELFHDFVPPLLGSSLFFWSMVSATVGLFAACIPSLRALWAHPPPAHSSPEAAIVRSRTPSYASSWTSQLKMFSKTSPAQEDISP